MLSGAVTMSRVPKLTARSRNVPIPNSHTASLTQALDESGGIVSERRQGLISGNVHLTIVMFPRA